MVVAPGKGRFQIDPAAVQCTGSAGACFRLGFAHVVDLLLQLGDEAGSLARIFVKERFQLRIFHAISGLLKTFLAIFEGFDQVIDNRYNFLLFFRTNLVARRCLRACLDYQC